MTIKNHRSFICGVKGKVLLKKEIDFLRKYKPWGVILFTRNIGNIKQTINLTNSIKKIFNNKSYPIIIDEEGGRVSRLKKFIDNSIFSAEYFGNLYKRDRKKFDTYYAVYIKQISYLLRLLGININTVPVLDVKRKKFHKIVDDRSFSNDKKIVSKIGDRCIELFHTNRIGTVIKHIPGHGLAKVDSHKNLPIINKNKNYLIKNDFYPFKKKKAYLAITGHLLFKKIDPQNNATHSHKIINLIRNNIKFRGLIMTDDISMKAIKNKLELSVKKSFLAGCNLVLHCNGNLNEMKIVAKNSPILSKFIIKKTSQLTKIIG
tara:strand:- start:160 stop:1113 length:954 start_codon:yes stop_codon:yes gene_type:complete